ncbi:hypothetical protein GGI43DRAFT_418496 [Trichoderma evansii]
MDIPFTTCDGFWPGYGYCIKGPTTSSTSKSTSTTSKPSTTTIKVTPPGPTQSRMPPKCNKCALMQDGDGCETLTTGNKITLAQLCILP